MRIKAVVETAIYVDDLQAAETFYGTILGGRLGVLSDAATWSPRPCLPMPPFGLSRQGQATPRPVSGLGDGATFMQGGFTFQITYHAGAGGNSVVVTRAG